MTDPRLGLPSASAMYRLENCTASHKLAKDAESQGMVPAAGDEADSGTRIHKWLETGSDSDWDALNDTEKDIAHSCEIQAGKLIEEWSVDAGHTIRMEARLALMTDGSVIDMPAKEQSRFVAFSGQADVIAVEEVSKRALIIDYKTGRGETEAAKGNRQLMALAALASLRWGLQNVRVAIVQPLCGQPTAADYRQSQLIQARQWLTKVLIATNVHSEPVAGDWCQYCPARAICPALKSEALAVPALPDKAAMTEMANSAASEILGRMLDARQRIGWWLEAIESAAKARLEAGDVIPGWTLKDRAGRRAIDDTEKAAAAVAGLLAGAEGGATAALLRSATLSPASLTSEIRKASGKKGRGYNLTEKAAKDALADALGALMTQGTSKVLAKAGELEGGSDV